MGVFMRPTNATKPRQYDGNIRRTIPYYDEIHDNILDLIATVLGAPDKWLDIGCGTGALIQRARMQWPGTKYDLLDPNPDMLAVAKEKLGDAGRFRWLNEYSTEAELPDEEYDVITAVLSNHYLDRQERRNVLQKIRRALRPGRLFITCEHTAPQTEMGLRILLSRWERYQIDAGKTEEKAASHIARYGNEYFPITLQEHLQLMEECGFSTTELLWWAYAEAVLYAVK